MKKIIMNISAGVLLSFSIISLISAGYVPTAIDKHYKRHPEIKQTDKVDSKAYDDLISIMLILGGGSIALAVGLAVSANKVKK